MTDEEYLAQSEFYFSESEERLVPILGMVPQHAFYAYHKMIREFGDDFPETPLAIALSERFIPSTDVLRKQLAEYGKATVAAEVGVSTARSRLRRAGAATTRREGKFVVGYPPSIKVSVRAKR